jgi:hypothetical protein
LDQGAFGPGRPRAVEAIDVGQQLESETLAFDPSSTLGADVAQQLRSLVSPEASGAPPAMISRSATCSRQVAWVRKATRSSWRSITIRITAV